MKRRVPLPVWILGIVSLLNDIASEMIAPLVPIFLTTVLRTSIPIVGLIEGIAEATASLTKYSFGAWSDRLRRRKPFVIAGYSFGAVSKILIGLATGWSFVLTARFVDRLGKGLRTAARDSILYANTTPENRGFIFGLHRAMDSLGAVIGPLLALAALLWWTDDLRLIFLIAFLPGACSVILLWLGIREPKPAAQSIQQPVPRISWRSLPKPLVGFLAANLVFALGNSADAFIILRGQQFGLVTTTIILMYVLYNVVQSVFATPAGAWADRIGKRRVLLLGWIVFAVVYGLFGMMSSGAWLWILFPIYGLYLAFTDGVGKAYLSQYVTKETSGRIFGLYHSAIALGNLFASVVAGLLWQYIHPTMPFYYGSVMAVLAAIIFLVVSGFTNAKTNNKSVHPKRDASVQSAS